MYHIVLTQRELGGWFGRARGRAAVQQPSNAEAGADVRRRDVLSFCRTRPARLARCPPRPLPLKTWVSDWGQMKARLGKNRLQVKMLVVMMLPADALSNGQSHLGGQGDRQGGGQGAGQRWSITGISLEVTKCRTLVFLSNLTEAEAK